MARDDGKVRVRALEPIPFREEGQDLVLLRDPVQVSAEMLVVSPVLLAMISLLDGQRTVDQARDEFKRFSGQAFPPEELEKILKRLDEAFFLDNSRFRQKHQQVVEEFRQESVRQAFHAGQSYPDQSAELADLISSFYLDSAGAGLPGRGDSKPLRALIAPHIDLRLGGPCYSHAYRALAQSAPPDLFVILGTGHHGLPEMFSVALKDFETPLGTARVDREFAQLLRGHIGGPEFGEDLTHRNEHTIEFQVLFLQHLLRGRPFRILPVLVSFSYLDFELKEVAARQQRLFWTFVQALQKAESESGRSICYIASVDLTHMGPRYGDRFQPSQEHIQKARARDAEMLNEVLAGSPGGFFDYVRDEEDRRRICGFSPLYTMLTLLQGRKGELLNHSQAVMDDSGSFVTFASAVVR